MLIFKRIYLTNKKTSKSIPVNPGLKWKSLEYSVPFETLLLPLRLSGYFLYDTIHVESLSSSCSSPPAAVIVSEDYLSVFFEEFSHVGSYKPPFKDLAVLIKVLETVQDTIIMSHKFFYDKILVAENQVVHNLLCCHCI